MKPLLNVYALPTLVAPAELADGTAVVIDVLRASTTIVHALDAGAKEVMPCLEIADALAAAGLPADECVLGGERGGLPIDGFDLGNSPEEYTPDRVAGKTVILTTTNGTRAMLHVRAAREILIAGFVNAAAVVQALLDRDQVHIVCAGTDGQVSEDDVLLAGLLVERLQRLGGRIYQQNAQAITAREFWLHSFALPSALDAEPLAPETLAERLCESLGGKNLLALDMADDILAAAQLDRFAGVPRFDPRTRRIRLA